MRGWIVAGLVVLAISAGAGLQSNGLVDEEAHPAPNALSRAMQARARDAQAGVSAVASRPDITAGGDVAGTPDADATAPVLPDR
ncbi:MAG: hypothetical protein ABW163_10180 [Luteimonas sp.]